MYKLTYHNSSYKISAFTFIELSIIITIISVILTSSLLVKEKLSEYQKITNTQHKILTIKKALADYYRLNHKLPCPYDLNLSITELLLKSNHKQLCSYPLNNKGYFYGGVPVYNLDLPISYIFDEWHNKISYIVPVSQTKINKFNTKSLQCWLDTSATETIKISQVLPILSEKLYIASIMDKSGNNCNFKQDINQFKPQYFSDFLSNRAGVLFDGIDDYMVINNLSDNYNNINKGHHIFAVIGGVNTTQEGTILSAVNINSKYMELYNINQGRLSIYNSYTGIKEDQQFYYQTKYLSNKEGGILDQDINLVSFSKKDSRIKNIKINLKQQNIIDTNISAQIDNLFIGTPITELSVNSGFLPFILYEYLFFNKVLSREEITDVENYLILKWYKQYNQHNSLHIYSNYIDRKSTRLNSSHSQQSRMPSSA